MLQYKAVPEQGAVWRCRDVLIYGSICLINIAAALGEGHYNSRRGTAVLHAARGLYSTLSGQYGDCTFPTQESLLEALYHVRINNPMNLDPNAPNAGNRISFIKASVDLPSFSMVPGIVGSRQTERYGTRTGSYQVPDLHTDFLSVPRTIIEPSLLWKGNDQI